MGVPIVCSGLGSIVFGLSETARSINVFATTLTVLFAMMAVFPGLILWHWQRRMGAGHTLWFQTWRPLYIIGVMTFLFALHTFMQATSVFESAPPGDYSMSSGIGILAYVVLLSTVLLQCMLWLWWCDGPPRREKAIGNTAGVWVLWMCSFNLTSKLASKFGSSPPLSNVSTVSNDGLVATFSMSLALALIACTTYGMARRGVARITRWREARQ
jgi:hypothetical protein